MKALLRPFVYKSFAFVCLLSITAACSNDNDPTGELTPPEAIDATDVSGTGFVAGWNSVAGATGYQIDISSDNFVTFVTDYNSKSVTTTTETVTGLTVGTTYKYRVRSVNDKGVSANSNEITVTTTYPSIATVDGAEFTPTDLTLTDTRVGLELRMKNGTSDITLRLSDKVAGTYELLNSAPFGRTAEVKTAIAFWVKGGETFYGESGSVTVSVSPGSKVSITFSATGNSEDGASSTITKGKLEDASATPAGITQCVLATFAQTLEGETFPGSFGYDSEGRLIQFVAEGTVWNYFWTDSRITRAIYYDEYELREETWTYQDNLLTKLTGTFAGLMGDGTYETTYTYTGGKLTMAVREDDMGGIPLTYSNTIAYSGDNVSSIEFSTSFFGDVIDSSTDTYSEYDAKNNFWLLLAESTNNPIPIGISDSAVGGEMLSKNNVGKVTRPSFPGPEIQTFTYPAYTAAGYPTSMIHVFEFDELTSSYSTEMTYSGCN